MNKYCEYIYSYILCSFFIFDTWTILILLLMLLELILPKLNESSSDHLEILLIAHPPLLTIYQHIILTKYSLNLLLETLFPCSHIYQL